MKGGSGAGFGTSMACGVLDFFRASLLGGGCGGFFSFGLYAYNSGFLFIFEAIVSVEKRRSTELFFSEEPSARILIYFCVLSFYRESY